MKSIKEKAEAYDKVLEWATEAHKVCDGMLKEDLEHLFPELQESKDERIRKWLINYFREVCDNVAEKEKNAVLDWLEKQGKQKSIDDLTQQEAMNIAIAKCFEQGEQKPADKVEPKFKVGDYIKPIDKCLGSSRIIEEVYDGWYVTDKGTLYFEFEDNWELVEQKPAWSEKDETIKNNISHIIRQYDKISKKENQPCWYVGDCLLWMQNIKDRVQPQPKHEWSEEDKRIIDNLISQLGNLYTRKLIKEETKDKYVNWLKSLKDRYTWKPSDEQMDALRYVTNFDYGGHKATLVSLYE